MTGRRTLTIDSVVAAAVDIVETQGYCKLTLNGLAAALGVKPPSLYNHVSGIEDVWRRLAVAALRRMENAVRGAAVGRSGESAIREIAYAYRRFTKEHAELYRAFTNAPVLEGIESELNSLASTLRQVLRPFALKTDAETYFIRIFHSGLCGFVALEGAGFFRHGQEIDADKSFRELVESQLIVLNHYREKSRWMFVKSLFSV
jgi:AcrR family transcriptional regulator